MKKLRSHEPQSTCPRCARPIKHGELFTLFGRIETHVTCPSSPTWGLMMPAAQATTKDFHRELAGVTL